MFREKANNALENNGLYIFDYIRKGRRLDFIEKIDAATNSYENARVKFDGDRWTMLHHAVLSDNSVQNIYFLLGDGVDVNASSGPRYGYTPLHCCAITLNANVAKILIRYGADPNAKNARGQTMFDMALEQPNSEKKKSFIRRFQNSMGPAMNASTDASIIAYIANHIDPDQKFKLANVKNKNLDSIFFLIAYYVYRVFLKNPSMAHMDEIIERKYVSARTRIAHEVASIGLHYFQNTRKNTPSPKDVRNFADQISEILQRNIKEPAKRVPPNFESLVVRRVMDIATSTRPKTRPPVLSKGTLVHEMRKWTTQFHKNVQNAHRNGTTSNLEVKTTNLALATYMRNHTYRAPAIRPGLERPTYLYRGMSPPMSGATILDKGLPNWKGYIAFSRKKDIGLFFSMGHVLFRLRLDDVPRGTPWVWFLPQDTYNTDFGRKRNMVQSVHKEYEVLFPPGRLEFKSQEDRDISSAIKKGIDMAIRGNTNTNTSTFVSRNGSRTLVFDVDAMKKLGTLDAIVKAMTITLYNIFKEPNAKDMKLEYPGNKSSFFKRIVRMIQLVFIDKDLIQSGIDMDPFIGPDYDPVEIDVCYVQDRNARSVAYSVPYSRPASMR